MWETVLNLLQTDTPFLLYFISALISGYGVLLFTWWWVRQKNASPVYIYVTVILIGMCNRNGVELVGRYYVVTCPNTFIEFTKMWFWSARVSVQLVAVSFMVVHMTYRVLKSRGE
jgi:hypothetical protein